MPVINTIGAAAARGFGWLAKIAAAIDQYFPYVTMLLPGNGTNGAQNNTFLDSSTNNFTITRNGNTTQGTFSPYGPNWSNYFGGSDYLRIASNQTSLQFGTGSFTAQMWIYPTGSTAQWQQLLVGGTSWTTGSGGIYWNGNVNRVYASWNTVAENALISAVLPLNTWHHIGVTRFSSALILYINGVNVGTFNIGGASLAFNNQNQTNIGGGGWDSNFSGYISNLRVTNTFGAIPVPTAPLTAVTGTRLLTCQSNRFVDNSTNAFALAIGGSPSTQRFSPYSPSAAYSSSVVGGSGYFDGTGDYLSLANNTAFSFGTGDFTIECWVYPQNTVGTGVFEHRSTSNGNTPYLWYLTATNMYPELYTGTSYTSNISVPINAWSHIAISRQSGTLRQFVNGVQAFSGTVTTALDQTDTIRIMASNDAAQYLGYMSDMRVVKGTAVYTAAFTPPTAPLTAITNTQLLLSTTNAGIIDNAMMNDLETVGNAQISTTQSKFGGASMYFDGTGDWLLAPSSPNFALGTGDFTIEGWVYFPVAGDSKIFFDMRGISGADPNNPAFGWQYQSTAISVRLNSSFAIVTSALNLNQWYHIALVRSGTTATFYVDGVSVGSTSYSTSVSQQPLYIGTGFGLGSWNGYIDDLRITKGVARYTANFTPPAAPFPTQ